MGNADKHARPLFSLRWATAKDMPAIRLICSQEGMDDVPSPRGVIAAVNDQDQLVGFLRLQLDCGIWHVNPVAVYSTWRGYGVGRALVDAAMRICGSLALVARGHTIGFYEKLGFVVAGWGRIGKGVAAECDGCPMREDCGPQPMWGRRVGFAGDAPTEAQVLSARLDA